MGFKKVKQDCFDSYGNIIGEDLYIKSTKTEKFLKVSESFFIDCLIEFGSKSSLILAFILYNTNHKTNEISFTKKEIVEFLDKNPIIENSQVSISKRKINESIDDFCDKKVLRCLSDKKYILNPMYINFTCKSNDKLYKVFVDADVSTPSTKRLKTISRIVKSIGSFEESLNRNRVKIYDNNYIKLQMHNLVEYNDSKKLSLFFKILNKAENDDREFAETQKNLMKKLGYKKDTVHDVIAYLSKSYYIYERQRGVYMFNPDYISKSTPNLRRINLLNFYSVAKESSPN